MNTRKIIKISSCFLFGCVLLLGCDSDKLNALILIDGEVYNNPKVKDFDAKQTLVFEPYTGIYFKSSICGEKLDVILFTKDTEDLDNSSNLYNDDRKTLNDVYEDVKDENITALGLRTFTSKDETFWNPILNSYESNLGLSITKEQKENGSIWKHTGEKILEIEYHPESGNLLNLRIYPIEKDN